MRIVICGSSAFKDQMVEYMEKLKAMGHEPVVHPVYIAWANGDVPEWVEQVKREHHEVKKRYGFIKWYYKAIVSSDAILVLNLDKNGVKDYIGGNTLMEMGFAHVNDKKVFMLNPVPDVGYRDEILATVTAVINGDLGLIR